MAAGLLRLRVRLLLALRRARVAALAAIRGRVGLPSRAARVGGRLLRARGAALVLALRPGRLTLRLTRVRLTAAPRVGGALGIGVRRARRGPRIGGLPSARVVGVGLTRLPLAARVRRHRLTLVRPGAVAAGVRLLRAAGLPAEPSLWLSLTRLPGLTRLTALAARIGPRSSWRPLGLTIPRVLIGLLSVAGIARVGRRPAPSVRILTRTLVLARALRAAGRGPIPALVTGSVGLSVFVVVLFVLFLGTRSA